MSDDNFRIIDSACYKAYIQFDGKPDAQIDKLKNVLAKFLLETYIKTDKDYPAKSASTDMHKIK